MKKIVRDNLWVVATILSVIGLITVSIHMVLL
jgi:hypothetical protein